MNPAPSPWVVYVLRCRDGSLYTGITNDLARRLRFHAAGRASRYTRSRLPVRLVHSEPQPSRSAALKREAAIKQLPRRVKLQLVAPPPRKAPPRPRQRSERSRGSPRPTRRARWTPSSGPAQNAGSSDV